MVGKAKQANRTKNNVRPSSSSHSAQLLGNTVPTAFGFSLMKDGGPGAPGSPTKEANTNIHSDFQIIFKQMSKKDPTTRFKALQMFIDSCNSLDVKEVVEVLPLWRRIYCILCTDIDHKVREISHKAQHAVVSKVKKMIVPHLKELSGPWFTSQYDTYPPAASAATIAFREAFPGDKYKKAIVFCQKEIILYIYDNLINQTPQSLCAPNTSAEDMNAKYERIVISSLQGYNLYLQKLSPDEIKEAMESNKKLLSNTKFWKYSKSKVAAIRNSFYHTVSTICQNAKFLVVEESSRLCWAVFAHLDESDPLVIQAVWEAALNVLVSIEDSWCRVNIEKQIFSKLFVILKNGGRNVITIFPNILPLLSKLPEKVIKNKETFYKTLFNNLRRGLSLNFVNQSHSDEKIITNTFFECFKYVIMRNMSEEKLCVSLVSNQLIPALEEKLKSNKPNKMPTTPIFLQTAYLLRYWHSNRNAENATYEKLIETFFSLLLNSFTQQVESEISLGDLEEILNNQSELMIILSNPDQFSPKHKGKVKFEKNAEEEKPETDETKLDDSEFGKYMLPKVQILAVFYFKRAIIEDERLYLKPLNKFLATFNAGVIFEEMSKAVGKSTPFKLFTDYFSKWLTTDVMKCEELVDMSLKLLNYVTDYEKNHILQEFCRNWFTPQNSQLSIYICKVVSNCFDHQSVVDWLRSKQFVDNMLNLVEKFVISDEDNSKVREFIATMLKAKTKKGEFIVPLAVVDKMMKTLSENLDKEEISHLVDFSQDLISRTKIEGNGPRSLETLVAALFKLSCRLPENKSLAQVWYDSLSIVLSRCQDSGLKFARKLSKVVKEIIFEVDEYYKVDGSILDQIILNVNNYVTFCGETYPKDAASGMTEINNEIVKVFINSQTDLWKEEQIVKEMKKICRIGYENNEDLNFQYLESVNYLTSTSVVKLLPEVKISFQFKPIKQYAFWNLFVGNVLKLVATGSKSCVVSDEEDTLVSDETEESESEDENETVSEEPERTATLRPVVSHVSKFLMSVGLFEAFAKYYASTKHFYQLKSSIFKLRTIACNLLKNVSLSECQFIYDQCKAFVKKKSTWWVVQKSFDEIFNPDLVQTGEKVERDDDELGKGYLDEFTMLDFSKLPSCPGNSYKIAAYLKRGLVHFISDPQWDTVFLYINNSANEFLEKEDDISDFDLLTLSSIARLFMKVTIAMNENDSLPAGHDESIPSGACDAWRVVLTPALYGKFLSAWQLICRKCYEEEELTPEWYVALENVSDIVAGEALIRDSPDSEEESVELAIECIRLMVTPHAVIQISAFKLFVSLIPELVEIDADVFSENVTETRDEDENTVFEPSKSDCTWVLQEFQEDFKEAEGVVDLILSDFRIGDCCTIEPYTDSYTYICWYLLFSCYLMEMCREAHAPLRFQYGCWLSDIGYVRFLLNSVFKLMPQDVLHKTEFQRKYKRYFEIHDFLNYRYPVNSKYVERLACLAFRLFVEKLPTLTREWWKETDSKTSAIVDKVTTQYVSPILITTEFKNLSKESVLDQTEVKTYFNTREVVATYTVDEVKMDLILTLPPNYPLGTISIESTHKMMAMSNSRNLLFQLSKYFLNQNGTIWDALAIWKNSLDKKFNGREECYICYSIVQGSSLEIPRLSCYTCKKKFHSVCLYKWFDTSHKSTCPICRNLF